MISNLAEKQVVLSSGVLNYFAMEEGDDSEVALVFLHGWGSESKVWQPLISFLVDLNCYFLDLPGFGKSELSRDGFTLSDYVSVVKEFLAKIGAGRVLLVGHSFGARVALKFTAMNSSMVYKLVLVDSGGWRPARFFRTMSIFLSKIFKPIFMLSGLKSLRRILYLKIGAGDYINTPRLKKTFLNVISENILPYAEKIHCPTLVIWGSNDTVSPIEFGKSLVSRIPEAEFAEIGGAGHFSFADKPAEFFRILNSFVNK